MFLIFDTSILIELERKNPFYVNKIEELRQFYPSQPKISFISYYEYVFGIRNRSEQNKKKAMAFIELFEILNITKNTAHNLVLLKEKYEFPLADLLIAAQTMEESAILLTKDRDFKEIEEIDKIILS